MLRTAVALALLVVLMGVTGSRQAHAGGFFLVDTTADLPPSAGCLDEFPDADCSLRGAITLANSTPGSLDVIIFALGAGTPTITPQSALPAITAPVFMDGATGGSDAINISGAGAPGSAGLFLEYHSGSTIKNMVINSFTGAAGLLIRGGGTHTIVGNLIGSNVPGTTNFYGIDMEDTTNNTIGGASMDRNFIYGNLSNGIGLGLGANSNTIVGNVIGLGVDESTIIGNTTGIIISGSGNQIGKFGSPNIIAGNGANGVVINGADNRLQGNLIGVNSQGQAKPNGANGVFVDASNGTIIGGSLENGNVISGNTESGVYIDFSTNLEVSGNIIGLNPDGDAALPNGGNGVEVVDNYNFAAAGVGTGIEIGKPGAGNLISGNTGDGIVIDGVDGVSVRSNDIGVSAGRTTGFGNGLYGINVRSDGNTIGGPEATDGNFIAAHDGAGIFIDGRLGGAEDNDILNNLVGGIPDVGGNDVGIQVIADFTTILNNTIVRNTFQGLLIDGNANGVAGNSIGREGIGAAGNGAEGIHVAGNNNYIGPLLATQGGGPGNSGGNAIWDNVGAGVVVEEGTGNTISQNSIGDNGGGGIDLLPLGITPNDTDDPDSGANDRQNFPVITSANVLATGFDAVPQGGGSMVRASLNSNPNTTFVLEFFASESCNVDFPRSGEEYVGSAEVNTNSNGDAEITVILSPFLEQGEFVSATATHDLGSTSEFSNCILTGAPVTTPTPTPGPSASATPSSTPGDVYGDADCDGDVDTDDFMAAITEVAALPPGAPCSGNVGCEEPIDAEDALDLLKYVADPADFPLPPC